MSSIGATGGYQSMIGMQAWGSTQRAGQKPDASQLLEGLFSKLDTKNQGYVDKSELETALSAVNTSGSDQTNETDALFAALDSDGDGKVTKDEFSSGMQSLTDQLMSQLRQSGMGPPPPPPPDGTDDGFTKDELTEMAASGDSKRAGMLSALVDNFDEADTDKNGKISASEAMAYAQSQQAADEAASGVVATGETTSTEASGQLEDSVLLQFLKLIQLYASTATSSNPVTEASTIAVSA